MTDRGYFFPLKQHVNQGLIPHIAFVNSSLEFSKNLRSDGKIIPIRKGKVLINSIDPDIFFKKSFRIKGLLKYSKDLKKIPVVSKGDIVLIAPAMYTGNADWRNSVYGMVPGATVLFSILNMKITGQYIDHVYLSFAVVSLLMLLFQCIAFLKLSLESCIAYFLLSSILIFMIPLGSFVYFDLNINWAYPFLFWNINGLWLLRSLWVERKNAFHLQNLENELVGKIQLTFLPQIPNLKEVDIAHHFKPASHAGGDIFCIFHDNSSSKVYIALMDVTGHGIMAAMMTGVLTGAFYEAMRRIPLKNLDQEEILQLIANDLNEIVYDTGKVEQKVATMSLISLCLKTRVLHFLNAAHEPIILYSDNKFKRKSSLGSRLGHNLEPTFRIKKFELEPGHKIMMYSDGLFENTNIKGETLHLKDIKDCFSETESKLIVDKIVDKSISHWAGMPQDDDTTIVFLTLK